MMNNYAKPSLKLPNPFDDETAPQGRVDKSNQAYTQLRTCEQPRRGKHHQLRISIIMKSKLIAALIALTVSSPVFASKTIGAVDCGEWINRNKNDVAAIRIGSWLTGFMTGLNLGDAQNRDSLEKVSGEQIFLWMDNYCKANPLKDVIKGGYALMDELEKK